MREFRINIKGCRDGAKVSVLTHFVFAFVCSAGASMGWAADFYKCADGAGKVSYQARACDQGSREVPVKPASPPSLPAQEPTANPTATLGVPSKSASRRVLSHPSYTCVDASGRDVTVQKPCDRFGFISKADADARDLAASERERELRDAAESQPGREGIRQAHLTWNRLRDALLSSDMDAALATIVPEMRSTYARRFEQLLGDSRKSGKPFDLTQLGEVKTVMATGEFAELSLVRREPGGNHTWSVMVVRDRFTGDWLISGM